MGFSGPAIGSGVFSTKWLGALLFFRDGMLVNISRCCQTTPELQFFTSEGLFLISTEFADERSKYSEHWYSSVYRFTLSTERSKHGTVYRVEPHLGTRTLSLHLEFCWRLALASSPWSPASAMLSFCIFLTSLARRLFRSF